MREELGEAIRKKITWKHGFSGANSEATYRRFYRIREAVERLLDNGSLEITKDMVLDLACDLLVQRRYSLEYFQIAKKEIEKG